MSNTQKSWIGRPSVNKCNYDTYNYTDGNATVTRGATPPIPPPITGYEISKIQSNNGGDTSMNILYTSNIDQVNGGVYTHSAWILLTAGTYCRVGQHWNPWDAGPAQYIPANVWTRVSYTLTNNTNNYGNIANAYGTDGTIYVTAVQYEAGSTATPFIGGTNATRSNTQAILDLTNNNTVTATSLTYDSNGTFSFNGSSSNITSSSFVNHRTVAGTLTGWAYPTSTSGDLYLIAVGGTATYGASRAIRVNGGSWCSVNYGSATEDWNGIVVANLNTWQHVAYAWSGTTIRFYLNGVEYTNTRSGMVTPLGSVLTIGATAWSPVYGYWPGKIGTMQVYNRALTADEVKQNFNALRGRYGI
jgi:hypothetical protein